MVRDVDQAMFEVIRCCLACVQALIEADKKRGGSWMPKTWNVLLWALVGR